MIKKNIYEGLEWWILYEPIVLKAGAIPVSSWVSEEDIPIEQKQAILDAEAQVEADK